jgi:hypothetical protein
LIVIVSVHRSGLKQDLDRAALIHGAVIFRDLIERQRQIEDLAGVDFAFPDEVDELGQIAANRRRAPVQMHMRVGKLLAIERQAVRHADIALSIPKIISASSDDAIRTRLVW